MLDLEPATRALSDAVARIRDDRLDPPTPCTEGRTPREGWPPRPGAANLGRAASGEGR